MVLLGRSANSKGDTKKNTIPKQLGFEAVWGSTFEPALADKGKDPRPSSQTVDFPLVFGALPNAAPPTAGNNGSPDIQKRNA